MDDKKKPVIFCVDDDKLNLELLEALLSLEGYTLRFFGSGEKVLAQIAEEIPDIILLDIMMPGMSGFEVLERLRADERTHLIPVILVTALRSEKDWIKGIEAGCDDFVSKPFDLLELRSRIRSLLKISRSQKSLEEKEKLWNVIYEMSQPLIVCGPDWGILNSNRMAQQYLASLTADGNLNFLDLIYKDYSVSVERKELNDCTAAPKKFSFTKKNHGQSGDLRLEVSLEVSEDPAHKVTNIVLTLRDITKE